MDPRTEPDIAELATRLAGIRSEAFGLADAIAHLEEDRLGEATAIGETMQHIANQLGDVQELVRRARLDD